MIIYYHYSELIKRQERQGTESYNPKVRKMFLKNCFLLALLSVGIGSITIPNKAVLIEKFGTILEPESVIFHHENVMYFSVGVRLSLAIDPLQAGERKSGCNIGKIEKKTLLESVQKEVEDYFKYLPKTFNMIGGHYCHGTEIDCMLLENKWDSKNFIDEDDLENEDTIIDMDGNTFLEASNRSINAHKRKKRQALIGTFVIGGLTAAAIGLYNYVSNKEVQHHLEAIDSHIKSDDYKVYSLESNQKQYIEKSNNLFIKMYQGFLNNEKHLLELLCNASTAAEIETAGLSYSTMLDNYKSAINLAMEGKVTDFLVTHSLLEKMLSNKPELEGTVYSIDPGLFYISSTSMLTKVDPSHNTAYFLITTPILKQEDVSPLYRVTNFGWIENNMVIHLKLPEFVYYLTDVRKGAKMIASPDLSKCQNKKGLYICNLKETSMDDGTNCLQHILHANDTKGCKIVTRMSSHHCMYKVLKSGIGVFGCDKIGKGTTVRGMSSWKSIDIDPNFFHFFPYSGFESITVGSSTITSKKTYMRVFKKTKLSLPAVNISPYTHLMLPGVEHEIEELEHFRKNISSSFLGRIQNSASEHSSWFLWVTSLTTLGTLIWFIYYIYRRLKKCTNSEKVTDGETRFYLRDGRGISLL